MAKKKPENPKVPARPGAVSSDGSGGVPSPPPSTHAPLPSRLGRRALSRAGSHRHVKTEGYATKQKLSAVEIEDVGVSLRELLGRGDIKPTRAITLIDKICTAVQRQHAEGRSHGGLTPAHIRFVPDEERGQVLLLEDPSEKLLPTYRALYRAPETSSGGVHASPRVDVYALGCIFFEMLTGRAPFVGKDVGQIEQRHARFAVPAIRQVRRDIELPPALEVQLQRAMKKRAGDRHASAEELATAVTLATQEDERGTLHLSLEEANVLRELIAQKAAGVEEQKRLDAEHQKILEERARVEQDRQAAQRARQDAEEARRKAEDAHAQVEESTVVALSALRKSRQTLFVGVLILMLIAAGVVYMITTTKPSVPVAPPPPPPVEVDAGALPVEIDAGGEPDVGALDAGSPDAGFVDVGGVDAGPALRPPSPAPPTRHPRPKPKVHKPKVRKPDPEPKPAGNLPVTF